MRKQTTAEFKPAAALSIMFHRFHREHPQNLYSHEEYILV